MNSLTVFGSDSEAKATGLRYEKRKVTDEHKKRGWDALWSDHFFQYFCSQCDGELTPGPSGAGTNQVCEKCRLNFGCLPGALLS